MKRGYERGKLGEEGGGPGQKVGRRKKIDKRAVIGRSRWYLIQTGTSQGMYDRHGCIGEDDQIEMRSDQQERVPAVSSVAFVAFVLQKIFFLRIFLLFPLFDGAPYFLCIHTPSKRYGDRVA